MYSVGMASLLILFMAAFKDSPLSWAGLTYDRINAFHRWFGRVIVGIFLAHGIMIGYLQCVRQGTSFKTWIGRSDVRTGYIAFIFLFLLLLLYLSLRISANLVRPDGSEFTSMRSSAVHMLS